MKFRKKPVVIEAVQWTGKNYEDVMVFTSEMPAIFKPVEGRDFVIPTLEGKMRAQVGDWIIRGVNGEFYPCKPDIFEKTYEKVEEEAA